MFLIVNFFFELELSISDAMFEIKNIVRCDNLNNSGNGVGFSDSVS